MKISAFAVLTALAATAVGAADSPDAVRKELRKRYDLAAAAFKRQDVEGIMKLTSSDLTSRRPNGQTWNRNQLQVYMNIVVGSLKTVDKASFTIKKVTLSGDEAVAIVDHVTAGTLNGGQGKPRKIIDRSTDRDVWVKTDEGWKIKFTECLKEKATIDGKPIKVGPEAASKAREDREQKDREQKDREQKDREQKDREQKDREQKDRIEK
jgi:hypothetical protein